MNCGRDTASVSKAVWMRDLLGQTNRIAASLESLIWITASLRSPSQEDGRSHPGVLPRIGKSERAMLLQVIQGETPFQVVACVREIASEKESQPKRVVSLQ